MVPRTAGMIRSEYISFSKHLKKGKHFQERKGHTVGIGSLEVERRGGVGNDVDSLDCLVKGSTFHINALLINEGTVPRTE